MSCFMVDENSVVVQRWLDVSSVEELKEKYGLSGDAYILGGGLPGQTWVDGAGVDPAPLAPDPTRDLTRAEFNGMLAAKGFKGIWGAMQVDLEGVSGAEAEELRFQLEANLHKTFYNIEATLALVGQFRGFAATLNADYAEMLTDDNITAAWRATAARRDGVKS